MRMTARFLIVSLFVPACLTGCVAPAPVGSLVVRMPDSTGKLIAVAELRSEKDTSYTVDEAHFGEHVWIKGVQVSGSGSTVLDAQTKTILAFAEQGRVAVDLAKSVIAILPGIVGPGGGSSTPDGTPSEADDSGLKDLIRELIEESLRDGGE